MLFKIHRLIRRLLREVEIDETTNGQSLSSYVILHLTRIIIYKYVIMKLFDIKVKVSSRYKCIEYYKLLSNFLNIRTCFGQIERKSPHDLANTIQLDAI